LNLHTHTYAFISQLLQSSPERVAEAEAFLRKDLGLSGDELLDVVMRFPQALAYSVQVCPHDAAAM